jgi:hypothetical protein
MQLRSCVVVTAHGEGRVIADAVASVEEVELVVVDDGSEDAATQQVLSCLERQGTRVLRHRTNHQWNRPHAARSPGPPWRVPMTAQTIANTSATTARNGVVRRTMIPRNRATGVHVNRSNMIGPSFRGCRCRH